MNINDKTQMGQIALELMFSSLYTCFSGLHLEIDKIGVFFGIGKFSSMKHNSSYDV